MFHYALIGSLWLTIGWQAIRLDERVWAGISFALGGMYLLGALSAALT